jgi:hypothetical protein
VTEPGLGEIVLPVMTDRARDMPPTHLRSSLARVLIGWTGIHQESVTGPQGPLHILKRRGLGPEKLGGELGSGDFGVVSHDRSMLQLPLEVASIQDVHLGVAEPGEDPGQEGRVDVVGLAGTVDHHRLV